MTKAELPVGVAFALEPRDGAYRIHRQSCSVYIPRRGFSKLINRCDCDLGHQRCTIHGRYPCPCVSAPIVGD